VKPILYVGNRNYSSWSLRPWLALAWAGIDFETRVVQLGGDGYGSRQVSAVLAVSPTGMVPALHLGTDVIADSLAISEWAAEQTPALWPADALARAQARFATCEMHSGFAALREALTCNIRRRAEPRALSAEVQRDLTRLETIWTTLRARFGGDGPYLFGRDPGIVDAFFTPVATRIRTYAVRVGAPAQAYVDALLGNPKFREWEAAAEAEAWTIPKTDAW
jgi:glutathione S-transferase